MKRLALAALAAEKSAATFVFDHDDEDNSGEQPIEALARNMVDGRSDPREVVRVLQQWLDEGLPEGTERYRTLDQLGEGGMAFVHSAMDIKLRREVAVKTMRSPDDPEARTLVESLRARQRSP